MGSACAAMFFSLLGERKVVLFFCPAFRGGLPPPPPPPPPFNYYDDQADTAFGGHVERGSLVDKCSRELNNWRLMNSPTVGLSKLLGVMLEW